MKNSFCPGKVFKNSLTPYFGWHSSTEPPFAVTSVEVARTCPDSTLDEVRNPL